MSNTDSEPKTKEDVYRERNLLAIAFIGAVATPGYSRTVEPSKSSYIPFGWWPDTDDVNGSEWAVVWIDLPTGQVGWHVPMEMVPNWMPKRDPFYDGYGTETKNNRLREWAEIEV